MNKVLITKRQAKEIVNTLNYIS
jgi:hypothetical protein